MDIANDTEFNNASYYSNLSAALIQHNTFSTFPLDTTKDPSQHNETIYIESTTQQMTRLLSQTAASAFSIIMNTTSSVVSLGFNSTTVLSEPSAAALEYDTSIWGNTSDLLANISSIWKPAHIPKDIWVHPHWYQFPPQTDLMHFIFGLSICVLGIFSVIGNFSVMWVFSGIKGLRTPSNLFIINLAFSDFMMMATNFPIYVYNSYQTQWAFGSLVCEIYGFCGAFFGTLSIVTMAVISVDRYYVIVKPFVVMRKMNHTRASGIIAGVWIYVLAWCIPPFLGWNAYVVEGFLTTCSFDYLSQDIFNRAFVFGLFIGAYAFPLAVIVYCYFYIVKEVAKHEAEFKKKAKEMNVASLRGNEEFMKKRREIKTAKIALSIIFLWVFAWTPYAAVALMGVFTDQSKITPLLSQLPAVFAKTASVYNPLVYAISHPKFRAGLRKKLPWLTCIPIEESKSMADASSSASLSRQSSLASNIDSVRGGSIREKTQRDPEIADTKHKKDPSLDSSIDSNLDSGIPETPNTMQMKTIEKKTLPQPKEQGQKDVASVPEGTNQESKKTTEQSSEVPKNVSSVPGGTTSGTQKISEQSSENQKNVNSVPGDSIPGTQEKQNQIENKIIANNNPENSNVETIKKQDTVIEEHKKNLNSVPGDSVPGTLKKQLNTETIGISSGIISDNLDQNCIKKQLSIENSSINEVNNHLQESKKEIILSVSEQIASSKQYSHFVPLTENTDLGQAMLVPPMAFAAHIGPYGNHFDLKYEEPNHIGLPSDDYLPLASYPPDLARYMTYFNPSMDEVETMSNTSLKNEDENTKSLKERSKQNIPFHSKYASPNEGQPIWVMRSYPGSSHHRKTLPPTVQASMEQYQSRRPSFTKEY
uniref:Onychopsin n=1 Tax=Euperipatoides rowelli TaxID=49087 RepID=I6TPU8_EUPRO